MRTRLPLPTITALTVAIALTACGSERPRPEQSAQRGAPTQGVLGAARATRADAAEIKDVIRRFNAASLTGDSSAMCALVDPGRRRYLEQIGQPCEVSLSGTLTPESERDVRSRAITSIEISVDRAVAHTDGASGTRDLTLQRTDGRWLIVGT